MTQFKEKVGKDRELASAALFYYPVLMAADVLAYRATEVPVGDDQRQHVELMREIARRFNARFGETLVVPELVIPEVGARIMDLQEPERKMSTTGGTEQGTVLVLDEPDVDPQEVRLGGHRLRPRGRPLAGEARGHQPDRHPRRRPRQRPGGGRAEFEGAGYGDFKKAVAEAVVELLDPVRERYAELRPDEAELERGLRRRGREGAALAAPVLADVRERMGYGPADSPNSRKTAPAVPLRL